MFNILAIINLIYESQLNEYGLTSRNGIPYLMILFMLVVLICSKTE